jgi:hypothetical protein
LGRGLDPILLSRRVGQLGRQAARLALAPQSRVGRIGPLRLLEHLLDLGLQLLGEPLASSDSDNDNHKTGSRESPKRVARSKSD